MCLKNLVGEKIKQRKTILANDFRSFFALHTIAQEAEAKLQQVNNIFEETDEDAIDSL